MPATGVIDLVYRDLPRRANNNPEDDWVGLSDAGERRRRQNRLHQRAWRKKKASLEASRRFELAFVDESSRFENRANIQSREQPRTAPGTCRSNKEVPHYQHTPKVPYESQSSATSSTFLAHDSLSPRQSDSASPDSVVRQSDLLIQPVIPYLDSSRAKLPERLEFNFPLSSDHLLITLIQYNVLRATIMNMHIMSLVHLIPPECRAALAIPLDMFSKPALPFSVPPCLQPTEVQKTVKHDYWVDLMPVPAMRDNIIHNSHRIDPDEICEDVSGGLWDGFNTIEQKGIILWGDPWSDDGWEVTEGFAAKWSFILEGCEGLLQSTNRWRELRGEDRLVFEL